MHQRAALILYHMIVTTYSVMLVLSNLKSAVTHEQKDCSFELKPWKPYQNYDLKADAMLLLIKTSFSKLFNNRLHKAIKLVF